MFCKGLKFAKTAKHNAVKITVLILVVTQFIGTYGVPINFANNNKNNYNENHANRPLPHQAPPVPPLQRPASPHQKQQNNQNQGPEMEDFGRLHTNQKQFKRHAMVPPDVKATPGAFQQNPSEQFGQNTGANFRQNQMFDESHQNHFNQMYRHQPPTRSFPQTEDASGFHQRSSYEQNNFHARQHFHDVPPSPSSFHNHLNPQQQHEDARLNNPNQQHSYQQMLNDNEIFRERNVRPDERMPAFHSHQGKPPFGRHWKEQEPTSFPNTFMEFPGQNSVSGKPNNLPVPSTVPQPTAVAIVVPGAGGNSTLFIEYDVSDNDVTYETIVEVEDLPESVLISNHISPVT